MNGRRLIGALLTSFAVASAVGAVELPRYAFYSGNDVYGFCQYDRAVAFAYIAGLHDEAAHAAWVVGTPPTGLTPTIDRKIDFQLKRIVGYCAPSGATVEQVADVFCKYLKDSPEKRDGLPSMLFSEALTKAWPCPNAQ
jgi:Rap1a immunity proteins